MLSVHTCPLATLGGKKTGGMNVYVRELSAELARRGICVDVFTRLENAAAPHINCTALGSGARVIHLPAGPEGPLATAQIYPYLPQFVENIRAFAKAEGVRYEVLHSHYWLSGWAALELQKEWHVPVVHMFHTLGRMKNRVAQSAEEHEDDLRITTEQDIVERADCIVAATPAERIQLMWLYGADMRRIRVIPPGVNVSHFHPVPKDEARRAIGMQDDSLLLLFVGRIEQIKGIDILLQALAILKREERERSQNLCLAIIGGMADEEAGENAELRRLKALGAELGLDSLVAFLGAKNQETLQYYYSAAEAVIMPSHYESFGMVALEAMACGTPVIASEVGGLAFLVQDGVTGFHVPTNDPAELAGKIRLILDNEPLRREMAAAATAYAQRYSWPLIADRIEQLYLEVTGRQRPDQAPDWQPL